MELTNSKRAVGESPEAPADTQASAREISDVELKHILEEHAQWLESEEKEGRRAEVRQARINSPYLPNAKLAKADFSGTDFGIKACLGSADLRGAELQETSFQHAEFGDAKLNHAHLWNADLRCASLPRAHLEDADLTDANLEGADLRDAALLGTNLLRTKLRDANLTDAHLSTVRGLLAEQLAGANLSGVKLPDAVAKFDVLRHVAEQSELAKRLFTALLLGCIYAMLTVATTTDVRLLTNSASSPLPVIQTEVPIAGFYFAAPVILVALYLYFLLYLQRLWESLAKLPAVFPDGTPLDQKAYPWLLNGLARSHFKLLRDKRPSLSGLQAILAIVLAYWVVPVTLVFIWGRYLPRHEWWGTSIHVILLVAAFVSAILLYRLARKTLRAEGQDRFFWRRALTDRRSYSAPTLVLLWLSVWGVVSYGAIEGHHGYDVLEAHTAAEQYQMDRDEAWCDALRADVATAEVSRPSPTVWLPCVFQFFHYHPYLDLTEADISTKPPNWTGEVDKEKEEMALVKGAHLAGADLRHAKGFRSFLAMATLVGSELRGAILQEANLQGADLSEANLQWASLVGADLRKAKLRGAKLKGANLFSAKLQEADLFSAELQRVGLTNANLQGAKLLGAGLQGAHLAGANLQGTDFRDPLGGTGGLKPAQVKEARNWDLAYYVEDFLPKLGLPTDHNETLPTKLEELRRQAEQGAAKSGGN